jgi:hypothetical protein
MKRNLLSAFVFISVFFFPIVLFAQEDLPGYIITMAGDTVYGRIRPRLPAKNAEACIFREEQKKEYHSYAPFDIRAYRIIGGKYYVSKRVPWGEEEKPMFLEYLVKGEANLYVYRDGEKDFFFIERGNKLVPLKNEKKLVYKPDGVYASYSKEYIGVLKYLFSDYKSLYPEINKLELSQKNLIKFAKDFHAKACEGEKCIVYEKKKTIGVKPKFRIAPEAGMNLDFLIRTGNNDPGATELNYAPAFSFFPALEMTLYFSGAEKAGLVLYGTWMRSVLHGDLREGGSTVMYYEKFADISSVRAGLWFKGVITTKSKVWPFYFIGVMSHFSYEQSVETITERFNSTVVRTGYSQADDAFLPETSLGPVGGGGVEFRLSHIRPFLQIYVDYQALKLGQEKPDRSVISTGLCAGIYF